MSILSKLLKTSQGSKKRVGRGFGSGRGGHTSGKGMKGQKSRQGANIPLWFEGGQLPAVKRFPMLRGKGRFNVVRKVAEVDLYDIEKMKSEKITLESLKKEKIIDKAFKNAKIIATGQLSRKVTVKEDVRVSSGAKKAIEAAGGEVV